MILNNLVGFIEELPKGYVYNRYSNISHTQIKRGKYAKSYLDVSCAFDIETTSYITPDFKRGYMYVWQFGIKYPGKDTEVYMGRSWTSFRYLLKQLTDTNGLNEHKRLCVYIHNQSFEHQFLLRQLNFIDGFYKDRRKPLYALTDGGIEFRDSLALSGLNLALTAEKYCKTKKLTEVGFDYKKVRHKLSKLTDDEINYCINDVVTVCEYVEYAKANYTTYSKDVPLTKTGIVRAELTYKAGEWAANTWKMWRVCDDKDKTIKKGIKRVKSLIKDAYPSKSLYDSMMRYAFIGGLSMVNPLYMGEKIDRPTMSFDFKSSYPAVLRQCLFPYKFYRDPECNIQRAIDNKQQFLVCVKWKKIRINKLHLPCIPIAKLVDKDKDTLEYNGKLIESDEVTMFITSVDYETYKHFYDIESEEVINLHVANSMKLPKYVLDLVDKYYLLKETAKPDESIKFTDPEEYKRQDAYYMNIKSMLNAIYGMICTHLHPVEWKMEDGLYYQQDKDNWFEKESSNVLLLPQWSCWCTAWARQRLLFCIEKVPTFVYCDTDSIKAFDMDGYMNVFDEYNNSIIELNKQIYPDNNKLWKLGTFSYEFTASSFKCLGAKRYMYTVDGHTVTTIAGLGKDALVKHCEVSGKDIYDEFDNYMEVKESGKLSATYNNSPHSDILVDEDGIECYMSEMSSVALDDTEFTMRMNEFLFKFTQILREENIVKL